MNDLQFYLRQLLNSAFNGMVLGIEIDAGRPLAFAVASAILARECRSAISGVIALVPELTTTA